ncbi:SGNH/GDSL hydrolase family protein [Paenarthrobacter sp. GOM3]|uniref:SGNH/GDSL hydrolase family protein n=1 Tax=Paenarthrobacter sp. GOM3 TaxID=2782567 RepID=UPI001BA6095E|nr:SGNH/GDSL hydrolase family protein [Paenarthrobacter sp. GOM3]WOH17788.1 SGNH/GDSL hydrolase family protein [Paenarthrobacter sp. GOM3]
MRERPSGYLEATDGTVGEGPWRVRTDEHGFIMTGNEVPTEAPPMVFLGDSFVEATFTPEDVRFVSQVERHLLSDGLGFRCLNGGYSGATTLQLFNVFLNKVVPLVGRGGRVVFFLPQSDLPIYFRPHSYWYPTDRYAPLLPPVEPTAKELPKGSSALTAILGLAVWAAQEFEIDLILVTSPHRHATRQNDPYLEKRISQDQHDSLVQRREDIRGAVRQFVANSGVKFIDADTEFLDKPWTFYDELHLNDEGHDLFAAWLADQLRLLIDS